MTNSLDYVITQSHKFNTIVSEILIQKSKFKLAICVLNKLTNLLEQFRYTKDVNWIHAFNLT